MTTFEYRIVALPTLEAARSTPDHSPAVEMLDREGAAGWEAVGISTLGDGRVAVLMKRPTDDQPAPGAGDGGTTHVERSRSALDRRTFHGRTTKLPWRAP